jgi:hypothetical protein
MNDYIARLIGKDNTARYIFGLGSVALGFYGSAELS